jgi:hypothetical protein
MDESTTGDTGEQDLLRRAASGGERCLAELFTRYRPLRSRVGRE